MGSENAAVKYAAFSLRDSYYSEMARHVIEAAQSRTNERCRTVVDLGAGIGMSTMELLRYARRVIAVEPSDDMLEILNLNVMGDPRVQVLRGSGEGLYELLQKNFFEFQDLSDIMVDAVFCCQVFHLFNPPNKKSMVPDVLNQIAGVLEPGGVVAFDLGPSQYEFEMNLSNHRKEGRCFGEILTELSHPLYQRAHEIAYRRVKEKVPRFRRKDLWPQPVTRMTFSFLAKACEQAGFVDVRVKERTSPVSGMRIINFIRNGWSVWFRWISDDVLSVDAKNEIMRETVRELFEDGEFADMQKIESYHPTAVFTAVRS